MTYFFQIQNFNGCQKGPFKDSQTEIRNRKLEQNKSAFDILGNNFCEWGRGCGAVGRAVASDTRDPWFESQNRQ